MINLEKIKQKPIKELLQFSIINIDKPTGPTSFSVSHFVKETLKLSKTSHLGTLDPMVSGVLPVALGRACRLNDYLMHRDKEYIGIMRLHKEVSDSDLKKAIEKYIGKISQLPPVRSRVKRAFREREIKKFEILEISENKKDIVFLSVVQAGTYIRKLCDDIGKEIGGAHMLELRRTKAGFFFEETAVNLYDFEKVVEQYKSGDEKPLRNILIPAEEAILKVLPAIQVNPSSLSMLLKGKPIRRTDLNEDLPDSDFFALFNEDKFIEVAKKVSENLIIARPLFVFN